MTTTTTMDMAMTGPQRGLGVYRSLKLLAVRIRRLRRHQANPDLPAAARQRCQKEADKLCQQATAEQDRRSASILRERPWVAPVLRMSGAQWECRLEVDGAVLSRAWAGNPSLALYRAVRKIGG